MYMKNIKLGCWHSRESVMQQQIELNPSLKPAPLAVRTTDTCNGYNFLLWIFLLVLILLSSVLFYAWF